MAFALSLAGAAAADPVADANAGLTALNQGAYDQAIELFNHAIASGELAHEDLEFAYVCRGKAYLARNDSTDGIADLQRAVRLSPDDADAKSALEQALARQAAPGAPEVQAPSGQTSADASWGALASLAGNYYWYQVPGQDPHAAYFHAEWVTPQKILSLSVRTKHGALLIGEFALDERTGALLYAGLVGDTNMYGTAKASGDGWIYNGYFKATPIRDTYSVLAGGDVAQKEEGYANGAWQTTSTTQLVEVPLESLQAAGFVGK